MKMQGGDQLLLKAEAKSIIFGNPSPKAKKQLQITAQVKGNFLFRFIPALIQFYFSFL